MLSESGYIMSRLAKLARADAAGFKGEAEPEPSNSSEYYTHFAEGTFMLWAQARTLVGLTTRQTAQLNTGQEGHKAVQGYADWCCENVLEPETQNHLDQVRLDTPPRVQVTSGVRGLTDSSKHTCPHTTGYQPTTSPASATLC